MLRVTANTGLLREIADCLSILSDEVRMVWGEKGLGVRVQEGGLVALIDGVISDACFETYEVEPVEIGVEIGKLQDLLTLAGPDDLVELDYDENVGQLNIRVGGVHRRLRGLDTGGMDNPKFPSKIKYGIQDTDRESPNYGKMKEESRGVIIDAEKLSKSLRAAKFVGELVDLSIEPKEFRISVTAEAGDHVNVRFEPGELSELHCCPGGESTYSLQWLAPLTRKLATGLAQDVQVRFQAGYPLCLSWSSNDGGASWSYFLAPRVTNE